MERSELDWLIPHQANLRIIDAAAKRMGLNGDRVIINIKKYGNMLISIVLDNNTGMLISNFNFSLTNQRLKMMTKQFSSSKAIFGKITTVIVFISVALTLSCNQETIDQNSVANHDNEWWKAILSEHNIKQTAYNNFENVFEMGIKNSITDGVVTLEDACIVFKINNGYSILKSPLAKHDLISKTVYASKAIVDSYQLTRKDDFSSGKIMNHQEFVNLEIQFGESLRWKADRMESNPIRQHL